MCTISPFAGEMEFIGNRYRLFCYELSDVRLAIVRLIFDLGFLFFFLLILITFFFFYVMTGNKEYWNVLFEEQHFSFERKTRGKMRAEG